LFKGSIFPIYVAAVITNALGQDSQHVSVVVGVAFLTALMVDTIHRLEHQVHLSTKKKRTEFPDHCVHAASFIMIYPIHMNT
jgi:hypothetical protein